MKKFKVVCIIQARLTSTRFPKKVLEKVDGKSMIARVCEAARGCKKIDKVVVAWAHKFPHLDENDVLGRFKEIAIREDASYIVRITSDCPLITSKVLDKAMLRMKQVGTDYYCNRDEGALDGYDVQVFSSGLLWDETLTDKEHVIKPSLKLSVDTEEDLERVRYYA